MSANGATESARYFDAIARLLLVGALGREVHARPDRSRDRRLDHDLRTPRSSRFPEPVPVLPCAPCASSPCRVLRDIVSAEVGRVESVALVAVAAGVAAAPATAVEAVESLMSPCVASPSARAAVGGPALPVLPLPALAFPLPACPRRSRSRAGPFDFLSALPGLPSADGWSRASSRPSSCRPFRRSTS
jgi:hypothetical protein